MSLKIVLTHEGALKRKYGRRIAAVEQAFERLALADRKRGLDTRLLRLDSAADLGAFGATPVRRPADAEAAKAAVDAVARARRPAYIVLLGGPDVVPHQRLDQGLLTDDDDVIPSDLPYACDAPFSTDARDFTAPTRVVGRIPGVTGDRDPSALVDALRTAERWRFRSRRDYERALAISVMIWENSTASSLRNVFGHARDLQLVPPKSWRWPAALLSRRAHYVNCHGNPDEPIFQGQLGKAYPLAHTARYVSARLREGTVASVESCYGAQLYDPRRQRSFEPMVNAYLRHGAYGYFGSSTSTFGPSQGNACADLVCQAFMRHVLHGCSTGRAALEARQDYIAAQRTLAPVDLLTLAQFSLFGDPSIHPVRMRSSSRGAHVHRYLAAGREQRRARLSNRGRDLHEKSTVMVPAPRRKPAAPIARHLLAEVEAAGGSRAKIKTFTLHPRRKAPRAQTAAVHVASARTVDGARGRSSRLVVVAQSRGNKLESVRVLHSKGVARTRSPQRARSAHRSASRAAANPPAQAKSATRPGRIR